MDYRPVYGPLGTGVNPSVFISIFRDKFRPNLDFVKNYPVIYSKHFVTCQRFDSETLNDNIAIVLD